MNIITKKTLRIRTLGAISILLLYALLAGGSISIDFGAIFTSLLYIVGGILALVAVFAVIAEIMAMLKRRQKAQYEKNAGDTSHLETIENDTMKVYYDRPNCSMTIAAFGLSAHSSIDIQNFILDDQYMGSETCYLIDRHFPQLLSIITSSSKITKAEVTHLANHGWCDEAGKLPEDFRAKMDGRDLYLFSYVLKKLHRLKKGVYEPLVDHLNLPHDLLQKMDSDFFIFCQEPQGIACLDLRSFKVWDFSNNGIPDDILLLKQDKAERATRKDNDNTLYVLFFYDKQKTLYFSKYDRNGFGDFKIFPYHCLNIMFSMQDSIRMILDAGGYKIADYILNTSFIDSRTNEGHKKLEDIKQGGMEVVNPFVMRCSKIPNIYK